MATRRWSSHNAVIPACMPGIFIYAPANTTACAKTHAMSTEPINPRIMATGVGFISLIPESFSQDFPKSTLYQMLPEISRSIPAAFNEFNQAYER